MSDKRVKVIGYAKRDFYQNGVEYRNFSDSLVGNQFTSDGGTTLFTLGNFRVTTNLDNKLTKNYRTTNFSKYYSLNKLKLDEDKILLGYKDSKLMKLNPDQADLSNYAYFGSLKEFVRVSLEEIIMKWPASIYLDTIDRYAVDTTNQTFENYVYNKREDTATFNVNVNYIKNDFGINLKQDGTILNTFNKDNKLRDMNLSYSDYVVLVDGVEYPILSFSGYSDTNYITFKVKGHPFNGITNTNYHVKPVQEKINLFFLGLDNFGQYLLNRNSKPKYQATFNYVYETDNGTKILGSKSVKWPVNDGYNIDFKSEHYVKFVKDLLTIAENNDDTKSNIISNRLISKSLIEFDTVGGKMDKTLKVYGRNMDEIKKHVDGIRFIHHISYNKKNNIPDRLVKNLARTMGWELTSSLLNIDFNDNFLNSGGTLNLSPVESEIEFWRRLILNSPWVWKSKGTRKVVEFLLRFVGTPKGLVTFNEYIYKASNKLNMEDLKLILEKSGLEFNEDEYQVDSEGYPKVLPNNSGLYFQKGGQWYRQTSGQDSNLDVHTGNNPHIGPYDNGYEYMKQFNVVVPDFEPIVITTTKTFTDEENTFINYDYGKFDKFFDNNTVAEVELPSDSYFQTTYQNRLKECLHEGQDLTECTVTTSWNMNAYLDGVFIGTHLFATTTNDTPPTLNEYIGGLNGSTSSLPLTGETTSTTHKLIENLEDCVNGELNGKKIQFEMKLDFNYECNGYENCSDLVVINRDSDGNGLVVFEGDKTVVGDKECCRDNGFISKLVSTGYECYSQVDLLTLETEVYVFMDVTSMSDSEGMTAKASIMKLYNQYKIDHPNYDSDDAGKIFFLPVNDVRWLNYPNQVVDGNMEIATFGMWEDVALLPPNFNTTNWVAPKEVVLLAMVDEARSVYHEDSLANGLETQPTSHYLNNYEDFYNNAINHFSYFKGMLFPIIKDVDSYSASFILHVIAAMEGAVLTQHEIDKYETPIDVSQLTESNPYSNGELLPLKVLNWSGIYKREAPATEVYSSKQFIKDLQNLMIINEDDNIYTVDSTGLDASNDKIKL